MVGAHDRNWQNEFSEKEKMFLMEYAKGTEIVEAALKAGYAESTTDWIGSRIMSRPEAKLEVQQIRTELNIQGGEISATDLINEFMVIAQATITDFYDAFGNVIAVSEMDPVKARAIKEIKRTVNPKTGAETVVLTMHDKISALQNLGRIGGHYSADNGQQTGDVNIQINLPGGLASL